MKIEKLSENQIRCTLSSKDLEERHIKLSELAYGSEKAKSLFRDMIRKADEQFGFQVGDIPIMVEAIPANAETLVLLISKVEYPDELDTRFSKFSEPDEEYFEEQAAGEDFLSKVGASDILDLFRQMKGEQKKSEEDAENEEEDSSRNEGAADTASEEAAHEEKNGEAAAGEEEKHPEHKSPKKADENADLVRILAFNSLEQVQRLAKVLQNFYTGRNDLYRDGKNGYFLFLHKSKHTPADFNKVCNIASEYARRTSYTAASAAWFEEHCKLIRKGDALQMLAQL